MKHPGKKLAALLCAVIMAGILPGIMPAAKADNPGTGNREPGNYTIRVDVINSDLNNMSIIGASIRIVTADQEPVDSWTSDGTSHVIGNVAPGKYILINTAAPLGYRKIDESIKFTVADDGTITDISAASSICEYVNGTLILKLEKESTGDLQITKTIEGDVDANDLTNLTFKVISSDGTVIFEGTIGQFSLKGEKYVKTFNDLDTGKTYSVTESLFDVDGTTVTVKHSVNEGAEKSESNASGILLEENKTTTVDFRNIYVEDTASPAADVYISKTEITNGPEIEGATLVVTKDTKDGEVAESWISGKVAGETGPHKIRLGAGTYVLTETLVPDDFHLPADSLAFTVNDDKTVTVGSVAADNNTVVMIDDVAGALRITVEEESTGRRIPGAVVTITTMKADGTTETKDYTTDADGQIYLPNLPVGNDYSYKVTKIPDGYKLSTAGEDKNVVISAKKVTDSIEKIKEAAAPPPPPAPTSQPVPQTGDNDHQVLWIGLILLGIAGLAALAATKASRKGK